MLTRTRDISQDITPAGCHFHTHQPSPVNTLASMLGPDDGERARQGVEQTFKPLVTLQSLATDGDKYEGRPEHAPDVTHCTRDSGLRSGLRPSEIGSMAFFTSVRY